MNIGMGIKGLSLTEEEKTGIQKYRVSGLILFKRNIESLPQLLALCREIKSLSHAPLIMMDREGGEVDRLRHLPDFPSWPSPAWLADHISLEEIQKTAFFMASEMKALGICLNLAPVVDVPSVNSTLLAGRLLGHEPEPVSQKALSWIKGFSQAGMGSCVKHFPGHGGVTEDSHLKLPQDNRDLSLLKEYDLIPFQKAIEAGVDMVMTAHVAYPTIEKRAGSYLIPATLSSFLLKKVLRDDMGFRGLVVSDDLDMKALSFLGFSEEDIMREALLAGVDILLKCEPPTDVLAFLEKARSIFKNLEHEEGMSLKTARLQKLKQKYSAVQPVANFKELKLVMDKARTWYDNLHLHS